MRNLPNRSERRKMAKNLGLLGKEKSMNAKMERSTRAIAIGKLIHLRNLTEQRNIEKNKNQEKD